MSVQQLTDWSPDLHWMHAWSHNRKFYKDKRLDTDYSLYAPGEAVAAKCQRSGTWLRAKVVDIKPDDELVLVSVELLWMMNWC